MKVLRLHPGKERSLLRRHPWIFESAIARGGADAGETVRVESHAGEFLAWAAFSPQSRIRARVWSFDADQRIDAAFFDATCAAAIAARSRFDIQSDAMRLVHGESDGLPGLVVDRYGDTLVAQFLSAGAQRWKAVLADALLRHTGLERLYERSDTSSRKLEGLPEETGWLRGDGPLDLVIREHDWQLALNIAAGPQDRLLPGPARQPRSALPAPRASWASTQVLNCYCYTGGFSVAALAGGAGHVTSIDSSGPALALAAPNNLERNGFDASRSTLLEADVNAALRQFVTAGRQFDAIVLDPPKFAPTIAHAERAARAYKDINRLALKLLQPGRRPVHVLLLGRHQRRPVPQDRGVGRHRRRCRRLTSSAHLGGAPDHPMTIQFPEGEYLKGLVVMRK